MPVDNSAYPLNTRFMHFTPPVDEIWFVPPMEQRPAEIERDFLARVYAATVRINKVGLDGWGRSD